MHPALSAILSIQPSVLDEIMSNTTMTGRGLIARFLYASPPVSYTHLDVYKRKLITRKEAAEILGISIATLDAARNNCLLYTSRCV